MTTNESPATVESTVETARSKAEATISSYMDNVINGQEKMTEAFEAASKRSFRVGEEIFEAFMAGQRDVVGLSKTIAAEPRAFAKNLDAMMDTFIGMQQRSLDVAKTLYREQSDAAGDAKSALEPMLATTEEWRGKIKEMSAAWTKPLSA